MIPDIENDLISDFQIETQTSRTYKIENNRIVGFCDGIEAIKQTIYNILSTERFDYIIYSWNYGTELKSLIGKSKDFIISEIKRKIKDALIQDDRIEDVTEFEFSNSRNYMNITFKVKTISGAIEIEKVVVL